MAEDFREDTGEFYPGGNVVTGVPQQSTAAIVAAIKDIANRVTMLEQNGGGGSSVTVDDTLTKDGENPVKSKGIWSAIWGAVAAPAASVYEWVTKKLSEYAKTEYVDTEVKKKQDKLTAGDNITINGNTISASGGGSVNVIAEIDGNDISPSSITLHNPLYDRTVTISGDWPFSIYEDGGVFKDCYFDMLLSDVVWNISAEEEGYNSANAQYSGKRIFLSSYKHTNDTYRELAINIPSGTITYEGPEGYVSGSIYELLFKAFGGGGEA